MASKKSRVANLARRAGRSAAVGLKGTAITGGTGTASYFGQKLASTKLEFLNKSPLIAPLIMVAAGHFMKRKNAAIGDGLIGAGGYALGMSFDIMRMQKQSAQQGGTTRAAEAAAFVDYSDTRALTPPSDIREYDNLETEDEFAIDGGLAL